MVINGIEAKNLDNGVYTTSLSEWRPQATCQIQIERPSFVPARIYGSVFAVGNIMVISLVIVALAVAVILVVKNRQAPDKVF